MGLHLIPAKHDRAAANRLQGLPIDLSAITINRRAMDSLRFVGLYIADQRDHAGMALTFSKRTGWIPAKRRTAVVQATAGQVSLCGRALDGETFAPNSNRPRATFFVIP
jgi:hypothetical protein